MMTPDEFTEAINKGVADMRAMVQEAAERLEDEFKRFSDMTGFDERSSDRMRSANDQFQGVYDAFRAEAGRAASQLSEGMNGVMEEFRQFVDAALPIPGRSSGSPSTEPTPSTPSEAAETVAAPNQAKKKPAKKAATKKKTAKKAATKETSAKKAAKKKVTSTKGATKKAVTKKTAAAKRANNNKPAAKKASTKKSPAAKKANNRKTAAKKASTKKAATAKKTAKKTTDS